MNQGWSDDTGEAEGGEDGDKQMSETGLVTAANHMEHSMRLLELAPVIAVNGQNLFAIVVHIAFVVDIALPLISRDEEVL